MRRVSRDAAAPASTAPTCLVRGQMVLCQIRVLQGLLAVPAAHRIDNQQMCDQIARCGTAISGAPSRGVTGASRGPCSSTPGSSSFQSTASRWMNDWNIPRSCTPIRTVPCASARPRPRPTGDACATGAISSLPRHAPRHSVSSRRLHGPVCRVWKISVEPAQHLSRRGTMSITYPARPLNAHLFGHERARGVCASRPGCSRLTTGQRLCRTCPQ